MKFTNSDAIDQLFWKIALKDDESAFKVLFFDFFPTLCVFAHRYIDDWNTCEDIVQETFFKIWKNRKTIEINTSSRNFLITSVRNLCVDYIRKQDSASMWQEREQAKSQTDSTEDLYSHIELEEMLTNALSKLPENVKEVFELNRFEGKTYKEIAEQKGISIKTVEAQMTKALKVLRIELKDYLPIFILLLW